MRNSVKGAPKKMAYTRLLQIILFLVFVSAFFFVVCFKPKTKEEQMEEFDKTTAQVEPFRENLTECARIVKASRSDVQNFLQRIPQSTWEGKCFVACILKRTTMITNNKINRENLLAANIEVYGEDSDVLVRLKAAVDECSQAVSNIFEICEYASVFNDCMHMKMEHVLDKATMERRMEALGQMKSDPDQWNDDDDELLKLVKDEL